MSPQNEQPNPDNESNNSSRSPASPTSTTPPPGEPDDAPETNSTLSTPAAPPASPTTPPTTPQDLPGPARSIIVITASPLSDSSPSASPTINLSTLVASNSNPQPTNASLSEPTTAAPSSTAQQTARPASREGLAGGTVAGIAIGVAVVAALITGLITFLLMRRKYRQSRSSSHIVPIPQGRESPALEAKEPIVTANASGSDTSRNFLPQSADDSTVRGHAKTVLDQLGFYIENFYQNDARSVSRPSETEIETFDSQSLPGQLVILLRTTKNPTSLIQHALAHMVIESISLTGNPAHSLLPTDFILLPSNIAHSKSTTIGKPGFEQSMSRWRELTAYLRPDPFQDAYYIAHRDRQIDVKIQAFSRAFAPWQQSAHSQQERSDSLSAIFKGAAELGIFLFSQPSQLQFRWPRPEELIQNQITVLPTLVKNTDERGRRLRRYQTLVPALHILVDTMDPNSTLHIAANLPADPITKAILQGLYHAQRFYQDIQCVDEQTKDLLATTSHVAFNIGEARRLYNKKLAWLDNEERTWVDRIMKDTQDAMLEVAKLLEPARIDQATDKKRISLQRKMTWVLDNHPRVKDKHVRLTTIHQSLTAVLSHLMAKAPAATDSIPEDLLESTTMQNTRMHEFLQWKDQRGRRKSVIGTRF
ncbi:MAG: hypothetical protein Q9169_000016 [Polycauliona sp. 2 TL-2023]